jgi:hypothetical protein
MFTLDLFLLKMDPNELFTLLDGGSIFRRGLPQNDALKMPAIARIFDTVCHLGMITARACRDDEERKALTECFHNGWLHADLLPPGFGGGDEVGYVFSSSLHRWFIERKLYGTRPTTPTHTTLLDFVSDVISHYSPLNLINTRRYGPGGIQRPPEAQHQDEFYRCCYLVSRGSTITFPEFGMSKGWVDFYIPSRKWGVELMRDGDDVAEHCSRFTNSGKYTAYDIDDFIILDFRTPYRLPSKRHPRMSALIPLLILSLISGPQISKIFTM